MPSHGGLDGAPHHTEGAESLLNGVRVPSQSGVLRRADAQYERVPYGTEDILGGSPREPATRNEKKAPLASHIPYGREMGL